MNSHTIPPPCSDVNHLCPAHPHPMPARQSLSGPLGYPMVCGNITVLVLSPLFHLITAPKSRSGDAGHSDMPGRSCKLSPLGEKVCMHVSEKTQYIQGLVPSEVSGIHWGSPNVSLWTGGGDHCIINTVKRQSREWGENMCKSYIL